MKRCAIIFHPGLSILVLTIAAFVLLGALPMRAAVPTLVHPMGVKGLEYDPGARRVSWWSGLGSCGGELPRPAMVSFAHADWLAYRTDRTGMACGGLIEGLVTDEAYVYFSQGGWPWRLALGASVNLGATQVPVGVSQGFTPAAVARLGNDLYWVESDGSFSKLWRVRDAGLGQQELVSTGFWGPVRKLRLFYDTAGFNFPRSCVLLSEDGRLWKGVLDPSASITLLASGVADFDYRFEGGGDFGGQIVLPFCRVFAAQGSQVAAIHFNTGASSMLTTPPLDTVAAVAADDRRLYLIETFSHGCTSNPELICDAYALWRQDRPLTDFTPQPWVNFSAPVESRIVPRTFHATGQFLVWADLLGVRSISADAPPVFLNFFAMGLEIVQAVQNLNNDIPLVQGKPTYVRAYARTDFNTTGAAKFFPSGVLKVQGRLTPFEPFQVLGTLNPIQTPFVDDNNDLQVLRTNLARSYVFELPQAWTRQLQLQCEFTVNPDHAYRENVGPFPFDDNTQTQSAVLFPSGEQCWVFVTVKTVWGDNYDAQIERYGADFWRIIDRAVSMMPIERSRVQIHTWPDRIGPVGSRSEAGFAINDGGDWDNIRAALVFWSIGRSRPCACERYIGTVHPAGVLGGNTAGIGGECPFFANSMAVTMDAGCRTPSNRPRSPWDCPTGGETLAHEMGHTFCRAHVMCKNEDDPDPNYPYPLCTITILNLKDRAAHYGFDPLTYRVVDPGKNADLMSYGSSTWPSDYTWKGLLAYGGCFSGVPLMAAVAPGGAAAGDAVLVLTGMIDEQSERVELFPAFVLSPNVVDPNLFGGGVPGADSSYSISLKDAQGNTLTQAPLVLQHSHTHEPTTVRLIAQTLPWPAGVQSLQVLHNGQARIQRYVTPRAPALSLAAPRVDVASQSLECTWTATDADGDPLTFIVQYSPDDGASWQPLQAGTFATSLRMDLADLTGGPQARIRVIATDGLNSAVAASEPFAVPNNPPIAVIVGLRTGDRLPFGTGQPVGGVGHDNEDGQLPAAQLQWTLTGPSSGVFGGEQLSLRDWPPGAYVATLQVTDSAGLSASNSAAFEVLPLSVPERPSPVLDGLCADDAYHEALEVPLNFGWPHPAYARLSHGENSLHLAFTGIPFSLNSNSPLNIGLVVDTDWSRDAAPQTNDVGFYVDETGVPSQRRGDGMAMALNTQPSLGVRSAVSRGDNAWSAELKIPDNLLGGWGHPAGLVIHVRDENNVVALVWPQSATTASPATWAPTLFGAAPPRSNAPPVAVVRTPRVRTLSAPELIVLDGESSFDPEDQPLTYQWTQLAGPSVTLSNSASASPSFPWSPTSVAADFSFRLVVNDGELNSAPTEADLTLHSAALNPQPLPPVVRDLTSGDVSGALDWPGMMGDRSLVEASQDLIQWVPILANTVDFDGRVHFRDPDADQYPHRFYRASGLTPSKLLVYSNDFEGAVGSEWEPRSPVETTPIGGRHFLGQFGAETIALQLNTLPAHTRVHVRCDLFIIRTWDGSHPEFGPDRWQFQVRGGPTLVDATFSTYLNQSYPGALADVFPPRTGAVENDTLGYTWPGLGGLDSVYHFDFSFDHADSSLELDFSGIGLQSIEDEAWGLDNVLVELIENP